MTSVRRTWLVQTCVAILPLVWALACSDDDTTPAPGKDGGATGGKGGAGGDESGGSGGTPEGGEGGTGGGAPTGCDLQPCAGIVIQGTAIPACCIDEQTCGLSANGTCFPMSVIEPGDAGPILPPETIVLDPSCEDQTVNGLVYKGCCDPAGVCGAAVERPDLVQCLTPDDVRALGQPITTPSVRCGGRDSGAADGSTNTPDGSTKTPDSGPDGSLSDAGNSVPKDAQSQ